MTNFSKKFMLVGSLLRPKELLEYKNKIEHDNTITYPFYDELEGYKECEQKWVKYVVDKQIENGLVEISDGEYQRSTWHLDFAWGLKGIRRFIANKGYMFMDEAKVFNNYETRKDIGLEIVGKVSGKGHPFLEHYQNVKKIAEDRIVKLTIPAPAQIYQDLLITTGDAIDRSEFYNSYEEFEHDFINAYKEFLNEYSKLNSSIIQMDDCVWARFADDESFRTSDKRGLNRMEMAELNVNMNNEVAEYARSLGLKVYGHNCRGNYASRAAMKGTYEATDLFLKNLKYDRFYLEWDDDRAGSLRVLEIFKDKDAEVVIGALSSKTSVLDDEERALQILEEASKYIDKDRLYLSHQCGFASCDVGNALRDEEQWAKIRQGHEIAYKFFGE